MGECIVEKTPGHRQFRTRWPSLISGLLAATSLLGALTGLFEAQKSSQQAKVADMIRKRAESELRSVELQNIEVQQKSQQAKTQQIIASLESFAQKSGEGKAGLSVADRQTLDSVSAQQKQLSDRLSALETAIMNDPVKALSLPLLRKDFDALQDRTKVDSDALRGELGRLYTFAQWFMGLFVTTALSLLSLIVANFLKGRKPEDDRSERSSHSPRTSPAGG